MIGCSFFLLVIVSVVVVKVVSCEAGVNHKFMIAPTTTTEATATITPTPPSNVSIATYGSLQVSTTAQTLAASTVADEENIRRFEHLMSQGSTVVTLIHSVTKVIACHLMLYFFQIVYNKSNERIIKNIPLPLSVAVLHQLTTVLILPVWTIKSPRLAFVFPNSILDYYTIGLLHTAGTILFLYSLQTGCASLTETVKASHAAVVTALFSGLLLKKYSSFVKYTSVAVMSLSCAYLSWLKDFNFTFLGFISALAATCCYQLRTVLVKRVAERSKFETGTVYAANILRFSILLSSFFIAPLTLLYERHEIMSHIKQALRRRTTQDDHSFLLSNILTAGLSHYACNVISFWILDMLNPVACALGDNTRGVFLMILDQTDSIVVNRGKKIVPLITIAALAVYTLQR